MDYLNYEIIARTFKICNLEFILLELSVQQDLFY